MKRVHRDTDNLARRLERAAGIIPTIHDHLNEQRANMTVLSAPQGGGGSKGDHSDPTLRAVSALSAIEYHRRAIDDQVHCVRVAVNLLEEACRDALGHRAAKSASADHPRCTAGRIYIDGQGRERESTCDRLVSYRVADSGTIHLDPGGLCDEHRLHLEREAARADETNARRQRRHRAAS